MEKQAHAENMMKVDQFGDVRIYAPDMPQGQNPRGVIALLSPSKGWTNEAQTIALSLQKEGNIVLGFDVAAYAENRKTSNDTCLYPSGLIENAIATVQRDLKIQDFQRADVVGLGDSGGLAAILAYQTLEGTYASVIAPHFCPRLSLAKHLCLGTRLKKERDLYDLKPEAKTETATYLSRAANCEANAIWPLTRKSDEDLAFIRQSLAQKRQEETRNEIAALANGPFVFLKGKGDAKNPWLVLFYSGDGGWRDIDKQIGGYLQNQGYSVIGVDSLRAFWRKQKPEDVAQKMQEAIREGKKAWRKTRVAVMGYSFGADILPFVVPLLADPSVVDQAIFLMLGRQASFEITVGAYFGKGDVAYNIPQAFKAWPSIPALCFYGTEEKKNTSCTENHDWLTAAARQGGHHFDRNYAAITTEIIRTLSEVKKIFLKQ